MCAIRLTMEDCARKVQRQGLFSTNATAKTFNSWRDQRVGKGELLSPESQSSSNIARVDVWVVNPWWIRMILRRKFSVPKICCPRSIQATHAFHSEVSIRFFGLWSPKRFVVASFDVGPMFPCNKSQEAMKNWHFFLLISCPCSRNSCLLGNLSLHSLREA